MMIKKPFMAKESVSYLGTALLTLLLLLAGCDGGISGTGPGPIIPAGTDSPIEGADSSMDPADPLDPADPADPTDGAPVLTECDVDSSSEACLLSPDVNLRIINSAPSLTDAVVVTSEPDGATVVDLPGLHFSDTVPDYRQVDTSNLTSLDIHLAEIYRNSGEPFASVPLDPVSTDHALLIVRDKLDQTGPEARLLPVAPSTQNDKTLVRIVHANPRLANLGDLHLELVDETATPHNTAIESYRLAYETVASDYREIPAGTYSLYIRSEATGFLQGEAITGITLSAGHVVTLVLRPDISTELATDVDLVIVIDHIDD